MGSHKKLNSSNNYGGSCCSNINDIDSITKTKRRRVSMAGSIKVQPHKLYDSVRNFVQKKRRESTGTLWKQTREISRSMIYL